MLVLLIALNMASAKIMVHVNVILGGMVTSVTFLSVQTIVPPMECVMLTPLCVTVHLVMKVCLESAVMCVSVILLFYCRCGLLFGCKLSIVVKDNVFKSTSKHHFVHTCKGIALCCAMEKQFVNFRWISVSIWRLLLFVAS